MTDIAAPAETTTPRPPDKTRRRSPAAWFAAQDTRELLLWGALIAVGADRALDRARRPRRSTTTRARTRTSPTCSGRPATTSTTRCCTARCAST